MTPVDNSDFLDPDSFANTGSDLENPPGYVSCSNCGRQFIIAGRTDGFSHCDTHEQWTPLPEEKERWL